MRLFLTIRICLSRPYLLQNKQINFNNKTSGRFFGEGGGRNALIYSYISIAILSVKSYNRQPENS